MKSDPKRKAPTTVKRGSVAVKIYRGTTHGYEAFTLAWYEAGERRRKAFSSLEGAKTEAEIIATKLSNGDGLALELTGLDRQEYLLAKNELRDLDIPLHLAVKEFVAAKNISRDSSLVDAVKHHHAHINPTSPQKTVAAVMKECLLAKAADGLSERYIVQLRSDLGRFSLAFHKYIADVTTGEIDDWLRTLSSGSTPISGRTRNNLRTSIITLFAFARQRGYVPKNIPTAAESVSKAKVTDEEIKILTPEQMERILSKAKGDALLHAVIGGFAGLRTSENGRLRWEDINLKSGHIVVPAISTKTASRRITPIPKNLKAWLKPLATKGPILTTSEVWNELTPVAKEVGVDWSQNLLRHSAISYRLALDKDVPRVAYEFGTSPAIIFKHYRQLCTEADAKRWFAIKPKVPAKPKRKPAKH